MLGQFTPGYFTIILFVMLCHVRSCYDRLVLVRTGYGSLGHVSSG